MPGAIYKVKYGWCVFVLVLAAVLAGLFLTMGDQAKALTPLPLSSVDFRSGSNGAPGAAAEVQMGALPGILPPGGGLPVAGTPTATPGCPLVWQEVDSLNGDGTNRNDLTDVAVVKTSDVWAVGQIANDSTPYLAPSPIMEHWNGSSWALFLPSTTVGDSHLSGVAAASSADVWAVGDYDVGSAHQPLLLHWDGTAWNVVPSPNITVPWEGVRDVAVVSSTDVWVVGSYLLNGTTEALALHWDGSVWTQVATPTLVSRNSLQGVTAISSNDVWAVGEINTGTPYFLHWDGTSWTVFNNPLAVSGVLYRVSAVSTSDIWAVGYLTDGSGLPLAMHFDGTSWSVVDTPIPCCSQDLIDVQAISSNDVWAISESDTLHWDGTAWNLVSGASPPPSDTYVLEGLGAVNTNEVWAVGHVHIPLGGGTGSTDNTLTEYFTNQCPQPTGTATSTDTPNPVSTSTDTPTETTTGTPATPTPSATDYVVVPATGTIVPGTDDTGNHCDDCTNTISFPFPVTLYDQQFNSAIIGSNGTLGFLSNPNPFDNGCMPEETTDFAIFPYWDDLTTDNSTCSPCGIFTSVTGSSPDRVFNIEWRAEVLNGDGTLLDFEVRLYEGQSQFDLVYGHVDTAATESIGVQRDFGSRFTAVVCLLSDAPSKAKAGQTKQTGQPLSPQQSNPNGWIIEDGVVLNFGGSPVTPTPTVCAISFTDVPVGSTFYPYIHCLACLGLINGYPDNTFRPNNDVTRGQLSKIVANAAGFNDTPSGQQFQDVAPGSTFYDFIYRLSSRGYINGYPCGGTGEACVPPGNLPYFRPNANSTRGQISKIVSNAAAFSETPSGQQFQDVPSTNPFYAYIYRLVLHQVMSGYPCGTPPAGQCVPPNNLPYFLPNNNATRGQTSKIVSNTFFPDCNIGLESRK